MPPLAKTTVYLDPEDYRRLKTLARAQGRAPAELLREAIAEYTGRRRRRRPAPTSLGAGRSGRGDVGERAEDLLKGMGRGR